jgi:tetratricopeptide (TPR) repeat protein
MSYGKWIFLVTLFSSSSLPHSISFAQNLNQKKSAAIVVTGKIELNSASLDKAWANRESMNGQSDILNFVNEASKVPDNFDVAWRVARLVYYIGNFGSGKNLSKAEQVKLFQYGFEAGKLAKNLEPKRVEGYYWYATNLGSYGLAKGILSALSNAKDGRNALLEAALIDPTYQWGGPYRILGRYYQEVPSVISFGDKKKALEYYNKAIAIDPNFRLNLIYLGILQKDLGEKEVALSLFEQAGKKADKDGKNEENRYKQELKENIDKLQK